MEITDKNLFWRICVIYRLRMRQYLGQKMGNLLRNWIRYFPRKKRRNYCKTSSIFREFYSVNKRTENGIIKFVIVRVYIVGMLMFALLLVRTILWKTCTKSIILNEQTLVVSQFLSSAKSSKNVKKLFNYIINPRYKLG